MQVLHTASNGDYDGDYIEHLGSYRLFVRGVSALAVATLAVLAAMAWFLI